MNGPPIPLSGASTQASRLPPRGVYLSLILTTSAFILANGYQSAFVSLLGTLKWLPLALLTLVAFHSCLSLPKLPSAPPLTSLSMAAFAIAAGFSLWFHGLPSHGVLAAVTVFGAIASAYCLSAVLVATDSRRSYFDFFTALTRVIVVCTLPFFLLTIDLGRGGGRMGFNAWTDNANTLAMILIPGTTMFMAGCVARQPGWLYKHLIFLLISLVMIGATDSRATMIWVLISAGAFWIYRRGLTLAALVTLALGIALTIWWEPVIAFLVDELGLTPESVTRRDSVLSGREEVWALGWELFKANPFSGYGLGSSEAIVNAASWKFVRHQGLHFHNSYLSVLVEVGLPGLIAFALALGATITRGVGDAARTCNLPREGWVLSALPFVLMLGAMGHAVFESWLIFAGNVNMFNFWTWFWMIHHQSQIQVRAKPVAPLPGQPRLGEAVPAR